MEAWEMVEARIYIILEPAALSFPELSLLVVLGGHLIVHQQEAEAAAAAASAGPF